MSTSDRVKRVLINVGKFVGVLACLYFFICSLDMLSSSFRLLSGRTTGKFKLMNVTACDGSLD